MLKMISVMFFTVIILSISFSLLLKVLFFDYLTFFLLLSLFVSGVNIYKPRKITIAIESVLVTSVLSLMIIYGDIVTTLEEKMKINIETAEFFDFFPVLIKSLNLLRFDFLIYLNRNKFSILEVACIIAGIYAIRYFRCKKKYIPAD